MLCIYSDGPWKDVKKIGCEKIIELCGWVTKPSKTRHHEGDAFEMGSYGGVGWGGGW